jgi:hypothetical protein
MKEVSRSGHLFFLLIWSDSLVIVTQTANVREVVIITIVFQLGNTLAAMDSVNPPWSDLHSNVPFPGRCWEGGIDELRGKGLASSRPTMPLTALRQVTLEMAVDRREADPIAASPVGTSIKIPPIPSLSKG